jgi:hypothetical protein
MRSPLKDSGRIITVQTVNDIAGGNSSGSGVFSDGTPWIMIKNGVGSWQLYFDTRLVPLSGVVSFHNYNCIGNIDTFAPGFVRAVITNHDGTFLDVVFKVIINWLDNRT